MKNNLDIDISSIPSSPGVYFWKDKNDVILYIGKSKNLKTRINQYLKGSINSYKTSAMLEKSNLVEYIVCTNDKEALLLEQQMIKTHQPFYNILLLDDKKYPFIVVEKQTKKICISVKYKYRENKNSIYYGPIPKGYGMKIIKDLLIRECLYDKGLPITNFDEQTLNENFLKATKILNSSNQEFIKKLKSQMIQASENEQYEVARDIRDQIFFLTNKITQGVEFNVSFNFDVIAFEEKNQYISIIVHNFRNGIFFIQEEYIIELFNDFQESIVAFLNQFYQKRNKPKIIVLSQFIDKNELMFDIKILNPKKGKYKLALDNAIKNAKINIDFKINKYTNKQNQKDSVKKFLFSKINKEINDILMIDTSSFGNKDVVCVVIYYKNYQPFPKQYRKYKINFDVKRLSDVEYMKIGIEKYFKDDSNIRPDLIIVDGGKAQINEIKKVIQDIPIVGLVKNKKHETEAFISLDNKKTQLEDKNIYNFFAQMQSEVDLYAKKFHRKKRMQNSLEGILLSIDGIGPSIEKKLLNYFKYYSNIFNASKEELEKVVSSNLALKIIKKFSK